MQTRIRARGAAKALLIAAFINALCACRDERIATDGTPDFRGRIGLLLRERCASCHGGASPAAGWRADSYLGAIGCTTDGRPVTLGANAAPIVAVFARTDHASLLSDSERDDLVRWVERGTPSTLGGVHPSSFADPRTVDSHVAFLRSRRYAPLVDPNDADACNRCHAGAPLPLTSLPASGATACTTCHAEPGGAFACSTCHGSQGRAYPPSNACFAQGARAAAPPNDPHAVHVDPTALHGDGIACATCHPVPDAKDVLRGAHVDGHVEVFFDYARAGREATFDPGTKRCTSSCHDRGGRRPNVAWSEGGAHLDCNGCHLSPPTDHYAGTCTTCHRGPDANGVTLLDARLHANGIVDRGDGSGGCGACHGSGADPWPTTNAHPAHAAPANAASVACVTCHVVPAPSDRHPTGEGARVRFAGLAVKGGSQASFDAATKSCASTYCHASRGGARTTPVWTNDPSAAACGSCHAQPPPPPHTQTTNCGAATICHTGSLATPASFTPAGKAAHVDGFVTRGL